MYCMSLMEREKKEPCAMLRCVLHEADLEKKTALWNVVKMCIDFGPAPKICLESKILLLRL